jgi:hypothetical protein
MDQLFVAQTMKCSAFHDNVSYELLEKLCLPPVQENGILSKEDEK